jgi:hypothetical protein
MGHDGYMPATMASGRGWSVVGEQFLPLPRSCWSPCQTHHDDDHTTLAEPGVHEDVPGHQLGQQSGGERWVRRSLHYSSAAGSQTMGTIADPALTAATKTMHGNPDDYDTDLNTAIPICDARAGPLPWVPSNAW